MKCVVATGPSFPLPQSKAAGAVAPSKGFATAMIDALSAPAATGQGMALPILPADPALVAVAGVAPPPSAHVPDGDVAPTMPPVEAALAADIGFTPAADELGRGMVEAPGDPPARALVPFAPMTPLTVAPGLFSGEPSAPLAPVVSGASTGPVAEPSASHPFADIPQPVAARGPPATMIATAVAPTDASSVVQAFERGEPAPVPVPTPEHHTATATRPPAPTAVARQISVDAGASLPGVLAAQAVAIPVIAASELADASPGAPTPSTRKTAPVQRGNDTVQAAVFPAAATEHDVASRAADPTEATSEPSERAVGMATPVIDALPAPAATGEGMALPIPSIGSAMPVRTIDIAPQPSAHRADGDVAATMLSAEALAADVRFAPGVDARGRSTADATSHMPTPALVPFAPANPPTVEPVVGTSKPLAPRAPVAQPVPEALSIDLPPMVAPDRSFGKAFASLAPVAQPVPDALAELMTDQPASRPSADVSQLLPAPVRAAPLRSAAVAVTPPVPAGASSIDLPLMVARGPSSGKAFAPVAQPVPDALAELMTDQPASQPAADVSQLLPAPVRAAPVIPSTMLATPITPVEAASIDPVTVAPGLSSGKPFAPLAPVAQPVPGAVSELVAEPFASHPLADVPQRVPTPVSTAPVRSALIVAIPVTPAEASSIDQPLTSETDVFDAGPATPMAPVAPRLPAPMAEQPASHPLPDVPPPFPEPERAAPVRSATIVAIPVTSAEASPSDPALTVTPSLFSGKPPAPLAPVAHPAPGALTELTTDQPASHPAPNGSQLSPAPLRAPTIMSSTMVATPVAPADAPADSPSIVRALQRGETAPVPTPPAPQHHATTAIRPPAPTAVAQHIPVAAGASLPGVLAAQAVAIPAAAATGPADASPGAPAPSARKTAPAQRGNDTLQAAMFPAAATEHDVASPEADSTKSMSGQAKQATLATKVPIGDLSTPAAPPRDPEAISALAERPLPTDRGESVSPRSIAPKRARREAAALPTSQAPTAATTDDRRETDPVAAAPVPDRLSPVGPQDQSAVAANPSASGPPGNATPDVPVAAMAAAAATMARSPEHTTATPTPPAGDPRATRAGLDARGAHPNRGPRLATKDPAPPADDPTAARFVPVAAGPRDGAPPVPTATPAATPTGGAPVMNAASPPAAFPAIVDPLFAPAEKATPPGAPEPPVAARIGQIGHEVGVAIARRVSEGGEELVVRLVPAELGRIEVRLGFDHHGGLRAVIAADSPVALELLRRDSADLSRALSDAGVRSDANSLNFQSESGAHGGNSQTRSPWLDAGSKSARTADGAGFADDREPLPYRQARTSGRYDLMA